MIRSLIRGSLRRIGMPVAVVAAVCGPAVDTAGAQQPVLDAPSSIEFRRARLMVSSRVGALMYDGQTPLIDMWTSELSLERSDFVATVAGLDLMMHLIGPFDVLVSADWSVLERSSRSRSGFVEGTAQTTRIESFPAIHAGLHVRLYDPGRSANAWAVGAHAGAGVFRYRIEQAGIFTEFHDPDESFEAEYASADQAPVGIVGLSIERRFTSSFGLVVDARYRFAEADLLGSYSDFETIDLSGVQLTAGLRWIAGG